MCRKSEKEQKRVDEERNPVDKEKNEAIKVTCMVCLHL